MEEQIRELTAEASTLGWRPGYRPDSIVHQGLVFNLHADISVEGDVIAWVYVASNANANLTVFND